LKDKICPKCGNRLLVNQYGTGRGTYVTEWSCLKCGFKTEKELKEIEKYPELKCPICQGDISYEKCVCWGTELEILLVCEECRQHFKLIIGWD